MKTKRSLVIWTCLLCLVVPGVSFGQGSSFASPCCNLGDVTADGVVNSVDAAWIEDYYFGLRSFSGTQRNNADLNGDGVVNLSDPDYIYLVQLGWGDTFPRCGDINFNGWLEYESGDLTRTGSDYNILRRHILGTYSLTTTQKSIADANRSCSISTLDIATFGRLEAGISSSFANCGQPRPSSCPF